MTVNVHHPRAADARANSLSYERLIEFWQALDEPLTPAELDEIRHPRTPPVLVAARCLYAVILVTVLVWMPTGLRAVSHALQ